MRHARITAALLDGGTYDAIAVAEGVSRRRVQQLLDARPGLREERARRQRVAHQNQRRRILRWSRTRECRPIAEAVETLQLPVGVVRDALGPPYALHPPAHT